VAQALAVVDGGDLVARFPDLLGQIGRGALRCSP
jgi:hypothetical protein